MVIYNKHVFLVVKYNSQTYADKNNHLIDSLNLIELSEEGEKLIDSSLILYYNATNDILKIEVIDLMVENFGMKGLGKNIIN